MMPTPFVQEGYWRHVHSSTHLLQFWRLQSRRYCFFKYCTFFRPFCVSAEHSTYMTAFGSGTSFLAVWSHSLLLFLANGKFLNSRRVTSEINFGPKSKKGVLGQWLYFNNSITVVMIFPPCPLHPAAPQSLRQSPHHCSCPWVMCISSLDTPFPTPYFTFPWLFCNYFLIPSPLHPFPQNALWTGNHQNPLCIHDSVSVLVCLVCFLDLIVDRYVFFVILFIVLIFFFFLNKLFNISYNHGLVMMIITMAGLVFSCLGSTLSALPF